MVLSSVVGVFFSVISALIFAFKDVTLLLPKADSTQP
jgi:hypothetical protein